MGVCWGGACCGHQLLSGESWGVRVWNQRHHQHQSCNKNLYWQWPLWARQKADSKSCQQAQGFRSMWWKLLDLAIYHTTSIPDSWNHCLCQQHRSQVHVCICMCFSLLTFFTSQLHPLHSAPPLAAPTLTFFTCIPSSSSAQKLWSLFSFNSCLLLLLICAQPLVIGGILFSFNIQCKQLGSDSYGFLCLLVSMSFCSRIVPEYSFLDARGLGAYEGKQLADIKEVSFV